MYCLLLAGVADQRQAEPGGGRVEAVAASGSRVDTHCRRQPLDRARAAARRRFERVHRIFAVGVDRAHPFEVVRVAAGDVTRVGVGHVEGGVLGQVTAGLVVSALEREQHELEAGRQRFDQIVQAVDIAGVDAARVFVRAAGVQVEQALHVFGRVQRAQHARRHFDAAAGVAGAGEVHMNVAQQRRVETVEHLRHQLVASQFGRQRGQAGIHQLAARHRAQRPAASHGAAEQQSRFQQVSTAKVHGQEASAICFSVT